jgi:uncharacterized protein (DUF983 family)
MFVPWLTGAPAAEGGAMALVLRRLVRGFGLRCPHCGARGVTRRWLEVVAVCPACRLRLDRGEPNYWLGALLFNLIAAEILFAAGALGVLVSRGPTHPGTGCSGAASR